MAQIQKALLLNEKFGKFAVGEIPREKPGPGEILIKVQSAALNPVDWKIQKYDWLIDGYPAVLGSDISGDVEEVGEGVSEFKKGDRVFGQADYKKTRGAFQQYVVSLAATTSKIPLKFSYDDVSTLPMALTTAYSGLYSKSSAGHGLGIDAPVSEATQGKYTGTPFFVLGGSSSVGQFVIQLAKLSGFSPIIATASAKHANSLKELGATHVLDRNLSAEALKSEISKITSKPIEFAYDSISDAATAQIALDILSPGGHLTVVLPLTITPTEGKIIVQAYAILRGPHNVDLLETLYHDKIYAFLENGVVTPNRVEVLQNGLSGVPDGLLRLEANQVSRLKLVARPQETA